MTTPVVITGFEDGVATPVTSGGGLCDSVWGTAGTSYSVDSGTKHVGSYALKVVNTSTTRGCVGWTISSTNLVVASFWIYISSDATGKADIFHAAPAAGSYMMLMLDPSDHFFKITRSGSTGPVLGTGPAYTTTTWYKVDVKVDLSADPHAMYCKIDGGTEFSGTYSQAATTSTSVRLGNAGSSNTNNDFTAFYDDFVASITSADYPINVGGVEMLAPTGEGTHSIAANTLEDASGNDIDGATYLAYAQLDELPLSDTTTRIQQNTADNNSYFEVTLGNITASHDAIIGASACLAYQSASATSNNGGFTASKDDFATETTVWGAKAALSDYSESSMFYKRAIIAGVTDDTTVNAIEFRGGWSSDATPDPYWYGAIAQVAYTPFTGAPAASTPALMLLGVG